MVQCEAIFYAALVFRGVALMDYILLVLDGLMKAPVFVKAAPSFPNEVKTC